MYNIVIKGIFNAFVIGCTVSSAMYTLHPEKTLETMSIDEKIGQLFIAASNMHREDEDDEIATPLLINYEIDQEYLKDLIRDYHIGGVIFLGKREAKQQLTITKELQKVSPIPLLIAQDAEWGLGMRISDAINFPRALTLGAIENNNLIYLMGREVAHQCSAMGINLNLAPVADVNSNPDNPIIGNRSFGDDPHNVAKKAQAFAQGMSDAKITACAKHYPGHGNTSQDSHYTMPTITSTHEELNNVELVPFNHLIKNNIPAIMVGHLAVPALEPDTNIPATLSPTIINDILRTRLAFKGLVITDSLRMQGLPNNWSPGEVELKALLAGNDILLCPSSLASAVHCIKQALNRGILPQERLDDAVQKIMAIKKQIFSKQKHSPAGLSEDNLASCLQNQMANSLKQILYNKAITLLHDHKQLLPLQENREYYCIIDKEKPFSALQTLEGSLPNLKVISPSDIGEIVPGMPCILPIIGTNTLKEALPPSVKKQIAAIQTRGNPLIMVLCASPYLLTQLPEADACIVAYEPEFAAQYAAAQALIGILPMEGKLPISIIREKSC